MQKDSHIDATVWIQIDIITPLSRPRRAAKGRTRHFAYAMAVTLCRVIGWDQHATLRPRAYLSFLTRLTVPRFVNSSSRSRRSCAGRVTPSM